MSRSLKNILVTGGSGFIGCNFISFLLKNIDNFTSKIINLDLLTYAGNRMNLLEFENDPRYVFEYGDICDMQRVDELFIKYNIDTVVHFAAESHVDRSIYGPETFIKTNVMGTFSLLEIARKYWNGRQDVLFHHISTDEVFGSLGLTGYFTESTPYAPRSPYSASKASSDHLVKAYHHTYNVPVTISNCSNNYGPFQFPEKLIPLMILNMIEEKPLPVYGDGKYIRDWLYVEDHNSAIWKIIQCGKSGDTYNIGGENEYENIKLINVLINIVSNNFNLSKNNIYKTITYVKDRPGHDRRYAIDCSKIKNELGWKQLYNFEQGLEMTVKWYLSNHKWVDSIRSGEYKQWIDQNYNNR